MRKSLKGLEGYVVKDKYNGLPEELVPYNYYFDDGETSHVIMAIPKSLLDEIKGDMDEYECPIPVKYVLEHGYIMKENHVIVEALYNLDTGLSIDESYYEMGMQEESIPIYKELTKHESIIHNAINSYINRGDNCIFEIIDDTAYILNMLSNPQENEIAQYTEANSIDLRTQIINNIIFITVKIGILPWIDMPYSPYLSKSIDIKNTKQLKVVIVLADSNTGKIKNKLTIKCTEHFTKNIQNQIQSCYNSKFDSSNHYKSIQDV